MLRAAVLALGVAGASGLTCNTYARTAQTPEAASTSTECASGMDACVTTGYSMTHTDGTEVSISAGTCFINADTYCDQTKSSFESSTGFADWTCEICTTDDCNSILDPNASGSSGLAPGLLGMVIAFGLLAKGL